jgi:cytochrome c oxidase subunit 1
MRRIYDPNQYEFLQPLQPMNTFITWAVFVLIAAQVIFAFNFLWSILRGPKAEQNPWKSNTLEWTAAPSPPPHGNFPDGPPTVYRGPYEYSSPESDTDYLPQNTAPELLRGTPEPTRVRAH